MGAPAVLPSRRPRPPLPKFWRPKLDASQRLDCGVVHWDLVDRFAKGSADREALWDWMETGVTYHQLMRLLEKDGTAFTQESMEAVVAQLAMYEAVAARCAKTGRAAFTGPELQVARAAAEVFDQLLELDRHGLAVQAVDYSTALMARVWGKR